MNVNRTVRNFRDCTISNTILIAITEYFHDKSDFNLTDVFPIEIWTKHLIHRYY